MRTPESWEKAEIKKYLVSIGAWFFSPYMAGFGKSGVPDICACIQGEFWGIEVKREGKEPTAIQRQRMEEIEQAGGYSVAGTASVVIEEIKKGIYRRHV
jgi:hypothetical protein